MMGDLTAQFTVVPAGILFGIQRRLDTSTARAVILAGNKKATDLQNIDVY